MKDQNFLMQQNRVSPEICSQELQKILKTEEELRPEIKDNAGSCTLFLKSYRYRQTQGQAPGLNLFKRVNSRQESASAASERDVWRSRQDLRAARKVKHGCSSAQKSLLSREAVV